MRPEADRLADQYVIFTVDPLRVASFEQWAMIHDFGMKKLKGCYKCQMEDSYITNRANFGRIDEGGWLDEQETVLFLGSKMTNGRRIADLHWPSTSETNCIGTLGEVTKTHALEQDAWSYDPTTDKYFVCHTAPEWKEYTNASN